ncbi:MAG: 5-formyltetrahydrofolate cyclo-ligase [Polyangiales bacterium]
MNGDETRSAEHGLRQRAKLALRSQMRAVRAALPESACDARSEAITERMLSLEELDQAVTILAFASIRNEVRTRPTMEAAWVRGKRVALPRVVGDELQLHVVHPDTELVEGSFSVPEPPESAERVGPEEVDFALIPALAVDPRGFRIGYGGGYYDRLLPLLEQARTCVLAYDFQLISEVPELPFDVAVDLIVTDERVIRTT